MNIYLKKVVAVFALLLPALAFAAPIAYVHEMSGSAFSSAGSIRHELKTGDTLEEGQTVVSGKDGTVTLRFADGQLVALQPGTTFVISKYRYNPQEVKSSSILFRLTVGAMRFVSGAIGKASPRSFGLLTPTATIGIRGTDCVTISDGETTIVVCDSGTAIFDTKDGHAEVGPGQFSIARNGQSPSTPQVAANMLPAYRARVLALMQRATPGNTPEEVSAAAAKVMKAAENPTSEDTNKEAKDVADTLPPTTGEGEGGTGGTGGGGGGGGGSGGGGSGGGGGGGGGSEPPASKR